MLLNHFSVIKKNYLVLHPIHKSKNEERKIKDKLTFVSHATKEDQHTK